MPTAQTIFVAEQLLLLGFVCFAIVRGGYAERRGAAWFLGNMIVHSVLTVSGVDSPTAHLVLDGIFATGLLPLAFFHVSWWIGIVALLAGASFGLQAWYLVAEIETDITYRRINNALAVGICLTLFVSALVSTRARKKPGSTVEPALAA